MIYAAGGRQFDLAARVAVMGILNVTPDSFSDGGLHGEAAAAIGRAEAMLREGADIIDVGGESTRPGASPVPAELEIRRVVPVIREIASWGAVAISVDTRKPDVAAAAIDAGAVIVNDVGGLQAEPRMAGVAAAGGASVIVMHMLGEPSTMQHHPHYDDLMGEIGAHLARGIKAARGAGVRADGIAVDPGIGFGKTVGDNLRILNRLDLLLPLGCPILVGPSRKGFIGAVLSGLTTAERLEGTMAAVAAAILRGARMVRVHDVLPHRRLTDMLMAILREGDHALPA
jgi:dihydropteroate synthase